MLDCDAMAISSRFAILPIYFVLYNTNMVRDNNPTEQTYSELQTAYDWFNERLFGKQLPACLITLQRQKRTMGYYSRDRFVNDTGRRTDEIAMNPEYFAVQSPHEVMSTLAHEMAHLWQDHFGRPGRGRYHNQEWAFKMESIGLIPSHNAQPGGRKTGDQMDHYIDRSGKFLAASEALFDSNFKISWYDRYPQMISDTPLSTLTSTTGQVHGNDEHQEHILALNGTDIAPIAANAALANELVKLSKTAGLGGRWKYTCRGCNMQAWAKPHLNIRCGDCELQLAHILGNPTD
jgi:predicted SprT family Zn-dependent metalloprotease